MEITGPKRPGYNQKRQGTFVCESVHRIFAIVILPRSSLVTCFLVLY